VNIKYYTIMNVSSLLDTAHTGAWNAFMCIETGNPLQFITIRQSEHNQRHL